MTVFTFTEGNLQITIKGAIRARKFDAHNAHGLSHCMKAVDFVVERMALNADLATRSQQDGEQFTVINRVVIGNHNDH